MQPVIEIYKGFEIRFDTDNETFTCDIDDSRSVKKSYAALKNFIRDWAKTNETFKKFKVQGIPGNSWKDEAEITIIGKHGNGNLLYKEGDKTSQLSGYERKHYMVVNRDNDFLHSKLKGVRAEKKLAMEKFDTEIKQICSEFKVKLLSDYIKENDI